MTGYLPKIILEAARNLRKNMTPAEKELWRYIREGKLGNKFLRQKPIFLYEETPGFPRYCIPDFCCLEIKIILEIDGKIHEQEEVYALDREKESLLKQKGFTILRLKNDEIINNIEACIIKIVASFP